MTEVRGGAAPEGVRPLAGLGGGVRYALSRGGLLAAAGAVAVLPAWSVVVLKYGSHGVLPVLSFLWRACLLSFIPLACWMLIEAVVLGATPSGVRARLRDFAARSLTVRWGWILLHAAVVAFAACLTWTLVVAVGQDTDLAWHFPAIGWQREVKILVRRVPQIFCVGALAGAVLGAALHVLARRRDGAPTPWLVRMATSLLVACALAVSTYNALTRYFDYFSGFYQVLLVVAFLLAWGGLTLRRERDPGRNPVSPASGLWVAGGALGGLGLLFLGLASPSHTTRKIFDETRALVLSGAKVAGGFIARRHHPARHGTASAQVVPPAILPAAPAAPPPMIAGLPDVYLLTVDALASDHTTPYGCPREVSPNMQSLADEGIVFERAYSTGCATHIGIPALLFSRYSDCVSTREGSLPDNLFTVLKGQGYRTARVSGYSWDDGVMKRHARSLARGFDRMRYAGPDYRLITYNSGPVDEEVATAAIEEIQNLAGEAPIALWVHFYNPHPARVPPRSVGERFGKGGVARYEAEVYSTDVALGRLLGAIRKERASRRRVILLSADHGHSTFEDGRWGHDGALARSQTQVPFIIHGLGRAPGRIRETVSVLSLAPTVLDALGVPAPASFMGRSLLPLIEGQAREPAPVFEARPPSSSYADGSVAVIQGRYKLYRHTRPKARWLFDADYLELYDLEQDRDELRNLADELPEVARSLVRLIEEAPPGAKPCFLE